MKKILRDFVSFENRQYPVRLGRTVASSLAGFVFGVIVSHIVWVTTLKYMVDVFTQ